MDNLRDLWDINIHIIGVPEGQERAQGIENLLEEIITGNIPKLAKEIDIQAREGQRVPNKINSKRPTADTL